MGAVKRREFLGWVCDLGKVGLVGLVATRWPAVAEAALYVAGGSSQHGGGGIMLGEVTVAVFAEWVGGAFRIHSESGAPVDVELIEATALAPQRSGSDGPAGREPFSILFRGPAKPVLPQKIYTLEHAKLGRFELFLVPIGPDDVGMRYEAVFN